MGKSRQMVYALLALAVLIVSFVAILVRISEAPSLIIAFYRLGLSALVFWPFVLIFSREELRKLGAVDWLLALTAGAFLGAHYATWFTSLRLTSVASATVLVTMQPVFVLTGCWLLWKERFTRIGLLGVAVALFGAYVISAGDLKLEDGSFAGDMLALISAGLISVYMLIGTRLRKRISLLPYITILFTTGALVCLVFAIVTGEKLYPYPAREFYIFAALALGPTVMGHGVFNWSLKYISASVVSVSILGEPVMSTLLAYLLLKESPASAQLIGGGLILLGIYVFLTNNAKQPSVGVVREDAAAGQQPERNVRKWMT